MAVTKQFLIDVKQGTFVRIHEDRVRLGGKVNPPPAYYLLVLDTRHVHRSESMTLELLLLEDIGDRLKAGERMCLVVQTSHKIWCGQIPLDRFEIVDPAVVEQYFADTIAHDEKKMIAMMNSVAARKIRLDEAMRAHRRLLRRER
ncbi:MAG: hypothetical protein WA021_05245 [Minisyncoccia bacterium]